MTDRGHRNGSPPDSFERFEGLARRLFGVEKREIESEGDDRRQAASRRRKPWFVGNVKQLANRFTSKRESKMEAERPEKAKKDMRCSFCGCDADHVRCLIAGPSVYICDRCVDLCVGIIEK